VVLGCIASQAGGDARLRPNRQACEWCATTLVKRASVQSQCDKQRYRRHRSHDSHTKVLRRAWTLGTSKAGSNIYLSPMLATFSYGVHRMGMRSVTALPKIPDGGVLSQHISLPQPESGGHLPPLRQSDSARKKPRALRTGLVGMMRCFRPPLSASQPVNRLRCFATA
jgi:hypothetical protein